MAARPRWSVNAFVMVFIDARWTGHRYRPQRVRRDGLQSQCVGADALMGRGVYGGAFG